MQPTRNNSEIEGIRRAAHEWRAVLSAESASDADRQAFRIWLRADPRHEDAFDRAETVWSALGALRSEDLNAATARPSLHERISAAIRIFSNRSGFGRPLTIGVGVSVATCALVAAIYVLGLNGGPMAGAERVAVGHATGKGELKTIALADGTRARLGAATRLEVTLTDDRRQVRLLSGAAYFDVASDPVRPFAVTWSRRRSPVAPTPDRC